MKIKIKEVVEKDVQTLKCVCGVHYWEDGDVNGATDEDGTLIPCRMNDDWVPEIDLATGRILNWEIGKTASVHYKVCDAGVYSLLDSDARTVIMKNGYVPGMLSPKNNGYGDYIIMDIDENGNIKNFEADLSYFES